MAEAGLMRGKRGLIMGVANNRSIAWGIAKAARMQGADLAFTYQGDALKKRVEPLAAEIGGLVLGHCDVTDAATIDAAFAVLPRPDSSRSTASTFAPRSASCRTAAAPTPPAAPVTMKLPFASTMGPSLARVCRGATIPALWSESVRSAA